MTRYIASIFALFLMLSPAYGVDLSGSLKQGGLLLGKVDPGAKVWLGDKELTVAPDGHFIFGFPRDAQGEAVLRFTNGNGVIEERHLKITPQTYNIERVDGLPRRTVTISKEDQARRNRERTLVKEARAAQSDALFWVRGFERPVKKARISGVYGSQRILNGEPRWPHYGLDLAAPLGTPVKAPAAGVVRLAQPNFLLEGGIIIIDHGYGVSSTLMHLNSVDVKVGQEVRQGEMVATLGQSGRATGPHLDWRINWNDVRIDPALALNIQPFEGE